jgi:methylenetetrahydrofolate dehydrogenase (NADP+)/methenyltetrahydrofolate cyclohydrolase
MLRLLGKPVAEKIEKNVRERIHALRERKLRAPSLVVILVGNDPASAIYTKRKGMTAESLGITHKTIHLADSISSAEMKTVIDQLNEDPAVDGILLQRPLPPQLREEDVVFWIDPTKDVDAFHPLNTGKLVLGMPALQPCTPTGVMEILKHYQIDLAGQLSCVIGRSSIVGKPMGTLLLQSNSTLVHCHSNTRNLREITRQADILIVAAGKRGLVDESFVRSGATVIDVGIHRTLDGQITGDVQFDSVSSKASALTPVPGGVGVMTIAILMQNTVTAAEMKQNPKS